MTKLMTTLVMLSMLLLSVGTQAQEQPDPEQPDQEPPAQEEPRKRIAGSVLGVKCLAPGNRESVTYDYTDPATDEVLVKTVDNVMVGSRWESSPNGKPYGCMGRCGIDCQGLPKPSRMYTQDCLAHDVCSQEQNASLGVSDENCGNEFRKTIGDVVLSVFNICRYTRGDHIRAAKGEFVQ